MSDLLHVWNDLWLTSAIVKMLIARIDAITLAPCYHTRLKYSCRGPENKPDRDIFLALFHHGYRFHDLFPNWTQIQFQRWRASINNGPMLAKLIPTLLVAASYDLWYHYFLFYIKISSLCRGMRKGVGGEAMFTYNCHHQKLGVCAHLCYKTLKSCHVLSQSSA